MRFVIIGAGIAGITSACELIRDGHEVTVIDQGTEPANFSSHANAGLICPGHAFAWASPAAPIMMLKSLWQNDQALRFRPRLDARQWNWIALFLRQCTSTRARINTERKYHLCSYSQKKLKEIVEETGISYDQKTNGLIYFYKTENSFELAKKKSKLLESFGLKVEALGIEELIKIDPGLISAKELITGGLYCPTDESGDSRLFTLKLANLCEENGAKFLMNTVAKKMVRTSNRIAAVETNLGHIDGDGFLVSSGVGSPDLLKTLGISIPIYPVKGYSVTLPITSSNQPPHLGGVDEDSLLAYCPLGDRLRITATAEISGYDTSYKTGDFRTMLKKVKELLPLAADYDNPSYWACLRPMRPTGLPFVDRTHYSNLWLNAGHGHMGWTMACGTAKIIADIIANRAPDIPLDGMMINH